MTFGDFWFVGTDYSYEDVESQARETDTEMSSHLYPEVSAHLLAATPTAHWLEYVDWANAFITEPLRIVDGCAVANDRPGNGLEWDEALVKRLEL